MAFRAVMEEAEASGELPVPAGQAHPGFVGRQFCRTIMLAAAFGAMQDNPVDPRFVYARPGG